MNLGSLDLNFSFNLGDLSPCLKIETIDLNYYCLQDVSILVGGK